jgi:hypothetical protein
VLRRAGCGGVPCAPQATNEPEAFLYAFDLLELDGTDLRREPIEVRKATLASILRKSRHGVRLNEHLAHDCGQNPEAQAVRREAEGGLGEAMTTLSIRMIKGDFVVTGPDVEPMKFKSRREARESCMAHDRRLKRSAAAANAPRQETAAQERRAVKRSKRTRVNPTRWRAR